MRTFVTSDLHLSDNPRDSYRLDFLYRLPDLLVKHNIDRLFLLGDLTEAKDRHSAWLVNQVVRGLAAVAGAVDETIVLRGNHDGVDPEWPFFGFLSEIPDLRYIGTPTDIEHWLFLPHSRDPHWDPVIFDGVKRIFTHNTFAGALVNGVAMHGIALDALPNVPIISGDIHNPQQLGRLIYVGAPYTVDFGDNFEPRALILDNGKLLTLKLHGPQKRVVLIDSVAGARDAIAAVAQPNDRIRVQFALAQGDYPLWPSIQQQIRDLCDHEDFILDSVVPLVQRGLQHPAAPRQPTAGISDEQLLKAYCRRRDLDAKLTQQGVDLL